MYPERLIRGISHKDLLVEGTTSASVFYFNKMTDKKKEEIEPVREDGFYEESISWYDNDEALQIVLNQKKLVKEKFEIQFKAGAAVLNREKIDYIRKARLVLDKYKYERRSVEGNVYHGNLLCHSDLPIPIMRMIAHSMALLCVEEIIPQTSI